jgi:hypothetical protein
MTCPMEVYETPGGMAAWYGKQWKVTGHKYKVTHTKRLAGSGWARLGMGCAPLARGLRLPSVDV